MSISQKDIKLLWGRAGSRCSMCKIELSHDATNAETSYVLGEQAHIVGESASAARGESLLSADERNTYHNLILLCPTHHTEIDKNEKDWPIEKLFQAKSKHELWVRESLSSVTDIRSRANDLIVSSTIDSIVELLQLETWPQWTSYALAPEPMWRQRASERIYTALKKVRAALWPEDFEELRRSAVTLALCAHRASETFLEHAMLTDGWYRSEPFYKIGGWNPNYSEDLARYRKWLIECYEWVYRATKAANWFADVVRRDINPMFFAEAGRFSVEEGPFMDGTYRTSVLQFTEEERASLPDSLPKCQNQVEEPGAGQTTPTEMHDNQPE